MALLRFNVYVLSNLDTSDREFNDVNACYL